MSSAHDGPLRNNGATRLGGIPTESSRTHEAKVRMVMLVDNRVAGDSRVIKSAGTAARAGYDVTVLGYGAPEAFDIGGIPVHLRPSLTEPPRPPSRHPRWVSAAQRVAGRVGLPDRATADKRRRTAEGTFRRRLERAEGLGTSGQAMRLATSVLTTGLKVAHVANNKRISGQLRLGRFAAADSPPSLRTLVARLKPAPAQARTWRDLDPLPQRLSYGWEEVLTTLDPDLIHAHDYRTLPAAIDHKLRCAAQGRDLPVVYDAHEFVQGYVELGATRHQAAMELERALIGSADEVITVSPAIADMLRTSYGLAETPTVVLNAPEEPPGRTPGPSLRERVGVGRRTPLMVYAGSVGGGRSIDMCIAALPLLPGVHLALVIGQPDSATALRFAEHASSLGVRDRLHLTRYVPQEFIADFVAEADIALTPLRHNANTENSMPTKTREYLVAGVPQVVSDVRTLSAFVRETGIGEVHVADDIASFAAAVTTVLADPQKYRDRHTRELRDEHTWTRQEVNLEAAWARALGRRPSRAPGSAPTTPPTELGNPEVDVPHSSHPTRPGAGLLPEAHGAVRLVVGPANSAGQGTAWAAAVRARLGVDAATVAMARPQHLHAPVDLEVSPEQRRDRTWLARLDAEVAATRTHVLLESGITLGGDSISPLVVGEQVARFEKSGLVVGMLLHGSEVRDPDRHLQLHPTTSLFATADPGFVDTLRGRVRTTASLVEWLGVPTFVSTLDLIDYVPDATWLPVTVDVDALASTAPVLERARPVVLHAPSNSALKGSAVIDPVLTRLDHEGAIRYLRATDLAHDDLIAAIASADIVVDQLGLGLYGVLACEAMGAGRLVVAEVGDRIRTRMAPASVPILEITATSVEDVLRRTLADRVEGRALAAAGPSFVREFHDGRAAAAALEGFLGQGARSS